MTGTVVADQDAKADGEYSYSHEVKATCYEYAIDDDYANWNFEWKSSLKLC